MRNLLPQLDPSWWMVISAGVFLVAFILLIVWVYLPSRRRYYDENAKIPLDKENSNDR